MLDSVFKIIILMSPLIISIGKGINVLSIALCSLLFIKMYKQKKFLSVCILCLVILLISYNFLQTQLLGFITDSKTINLYILSYLLIILVLNYCSSISNLIELNKCFKKYKIVIIFEVILAETYILYLFISKKGFISRWDGTYFAGTYDNPHSFTYSMILLIVVNTYLYNLSRKKHIYILQIVPMVTFLYTGARTPAICGTLILILINSKKIFQLKRLYKKILLVVVVGLIIIVIKTHVEIFGNIPIIQKFLMTEEGGNILSGRDVFWNGLITYLLNSSWKKTLLGSGILYSMYINYCNVGNSIWSHNDFIDIIISFGILGLMVYVGCLIKYFYSLVYRSKDKAKIFLILIIFILLEYFNGTINYNNFFVVFFFVALVAFQDSFYYIDDLEKRRIKVLVEKNIEAVSLYDLNTNIKRIEVESK